MAPSDEPLSSLTGPPVSALVPPGKCQFGDEFVSVPLLSKSEASATTSVYRFGLPDPSRSLGLSTCACILARARTEGPDGAAEDTVRPYTPISTNATVGSFDLLVKTYEKGRMSRHMADMPIGSRMEFKHIAFNVKIQAPFAPRRIGMLVGGTGITPMIQALHAILPDGETEVAMLYGSQNSSDILGREMVDAWARDFPGKLKVVHVLSDEPEGSGWEGETGFIGRAAIEKYLPAPSEGSNAIVFVCGPPPMYDTLCGPRGEKAVTGVLGEMGYAEEQVYKF